MVKEFYALLNFGLVATPFTNLVTYNSYKIAFLFQFVNLQVEYNGVPYKKSLKRQQDGGAVSGLTCGCFSTKLLKR